ncbi:MAG: PD-(D/E)XK nuclease family transposase, partial [Rhodospirillaceae bacterium]
MTTETIHCGWDSCGKVSPNGGEWNDQWTETQNIPWTLWWGLRHYRNRIKKDLNFMKFLNPKTDYAFKKIFGSEASKDILISF